jgi:RNA polymerase sigma-70 factor (ECF subfamily)
VLTPTDESLLAEYLAGKAASFELLVRRHAQELHQFVLRFTRSSQAAEDVVQEAFLQVHTSAGNFDTSKRFKPWLFTIAANKARDYLRAKNRKREVPIDATVDAGQDGSQRFIDLMQDDSEAPHEQMSFEERRRLVKNVVEDMPSRLSEVLVLAYYHRFPYKEIAEIIEVPLGTVKSRLHAAIAEFKTRLDAAMAEQERKEA